MPVGTVSPREALDPLEILRTRGQRWGYTLWGVDASLTVALGSHLDLTGTYSWVNRNHLLVDAATADSLALNAPRSKAAARLRYRNDRLGLAAALEGRAVGGFRANTATVNSVTGYAVIDASAAYQLPWTTRLVVSVKATNLLNHRHREIDGAPTLGRLVLSKMQVRF
jgi:outer membrane receptor protein involved in Fe transport